MASSRSPCGACKFLRRKCVIGCIFEPYFSYEEGATHFSVIHKVFGASNVSNLLAHLPLSDRCEAATTIWHEAVARLQDPIYGCVSHIIALKQQVVNLQAQLAFLKDQAYAVANPNDQSAHDLQAYMEECDLINEIPKCSNYEDLVTSLTLMRANAHINEIPECSNAQSSWRKC
ncbi:LOB domain-containing protein 29-like [Prunus avium]|uniref:LOB domain-containing protein 29-like n=1 Tax=Prunus avium TaxID=42229 RepID=A0A6P5T6M8_PRUAV|nr:LOB domain-containing protein 29-like [Prunus avium]XP_021822817.1 LOB domain-containing protein 29-like [Prunus avium]